MFLATCLILAESVALRLHKSKVLHLVSHVSCNFSHNSWIFSAPVAWEWSVTLGNASCNLSHNGWICCVAFTQEWSVTTLDNVPCNLSHSYHGWICAAVAQEWSDTIKQYISCYLSRAPNVTQRNAGKIAYFTQHRFKPSAQHAFHASITPHKLVFQQRSKTSGFRTKNSVTCKIVLFSRKLHWRCSRWRIQNVKQRE